jgi:hypothetical protein
MTEKYLIDGMSTVLVYSIDGEAFCFSDGLMEE